MTVDKIRTYVKQALARLNWERYAQWTTLAVLAFVLLFIAIRSAEADTTFEAIPATVFVAGKHYTGLGLTATERFKDKYDLGVTLLTQMQCDCSRGDATGNLAVHAQRVVHWKAIELGLGAAYWQNQTVYFNSNTSFALHWGVNLGRWTIRHRHYSTGGSSERNSGLDMLTFGYAFE